MLAVEEYRLRPLAEDDLELILQWRNSDRIRRNMLTDHIISREEHLAWYRCIRGEASCLYMVFEHRSRPAGLVYFTDIDRAAGTCRWGFYLGDTSLPRGSGTVMGYLALNLVFDDPRMRRVAGEVLDFNTASADFFRRLGFTPGDRIRRAVRRDGQDVDLLRFSMDGDDWRSREKARVLNLLQGNGTG